MPPSSTYRVQLHAGFGFRDAAGLADYFAELGIGALYCSPILQAAPGSTHGYDVTDPQQFNGELGGAEGHEAMHAALAEAGLSEVLDIVPNHMATDPTNPWWWDVLENGHGSRYARFFDIDWVGGDERVLVPILGDHYGRVLESGALSLARDGASIVVTYGEARLPLAPATVAPLLAAAARREDGTPLGGLAERLESMTLASSPEAASSEHEVVAGLFDELAELCGANPGAGAALDHELAAVAADPDRLDALLRRQNYRLAFWRIASEELDYRRFFNIETLAGVRIEDPIVFEETHRLVLSLVADGTLVGLRVDHVDGLRDPEGYLSRLSERSGGAWTVVEKILEPGERLPERFAAAGTSGYDFLTRVNNAYVAPTAEAAMTEAYQEFTGERQDYASVVRAAKLHVMGNELAAEVDRLTALLARVGDRHRRQRDHTRRELRTALREFVASYGVYRTYLRAGEQATAADRAHVAAAVAQTQTASPDLDAELVGFLGELALGAHAGALETEFALRLQQLTAPVMAKGVEDTAFYRYNRLVSLNEVGGDPGVFGRPIEDFHADSVASADAWPDAMLTISTHDTKRSADVRARLNVLSEIPSAWAGAVARFAERTDRHWRSAAPDRNAEYLLYQSAVGAWPIDADRLVAFMAKATKEAKVHTTWTDPDPDYDAELEAFVRATLGDRGFVEELESFLAAEQIVERGFANALGQVALLHACPGIPDTYQGDELWDLSLVDPDNRRPVDYERRRAAIAAWRPNSPGRLDDGSAKLHLLRSLLADRLSRPRSYAGAPYFPLSVDGPLASSVLAFARRDLVVVVPCRSALPTRQSKETVVELPSRSLRHLVTGAPIAGPRVGLDTLFEGFPVAVLAPDPVR